MNSRFASLFTQAGSITVRVCDAAEFGAGAKLAALLICAALAALATLAALAAPATLAARPYAAALTSAPSSLVSLLLASQAARLHCLFFGPAFCPTFLPNFPQLGSMQPAGSLPLVWEMGGSPLVVSSPVLLDPPVVACGLPPSLLIFSFGGR